MANAEAGAGAPQSAVPSPPRRSRRGGPWPWVALVLLAAALVGAVLGSSLAQRQGGPLAGPGAGGGRPTIVVAPAGVAPSVVASPSPSSVAPEVVAGATVVGPPAVAGTEYVVQPGDTLRSIAQQQYGDAGLWPRIYEANRDVIGPNPDALVSGTRLQLPPR